MEIFGGRADKGQLITYKTKEKFLHLFGSAMR